MSDETENVIETTFVEDLYSNLYLSNLHSQLYLIYEKEDNSEEIIYYFIIDKSYEEIITLFDDNVSEKNIKIRCDKMADEFFIINMDYYNIQNIDNKLKLYYKSEITKQDYMDNKYYNIDDLNEIFTTIYDNYLLLSKIKKQKSLFTITFINNNIHLYDIINKTTHKLKKIGNITITDNIILSDIYIDILNEIHDKKYNLNIVIEDKNINKNKKKDKNTKTKEHTNLDRIINGYGYVPIFKEDCKEIIIYDESEIIKLYEKLHKNDANTNTNNLGKNDIIKNKNTESNEDNTQISNEILYNRKEIEKIYEKLEKYCELKRQTHWMCSRHYTHMDRFFTIPSIILSSLSGIGSFLASTDTLNEYSDILTISVGVMASITTLFQSFSNAFEYSTKSEAHQNATEAFDQIITKLRFEKLNPKANLNAVEFIDGVEKQIVETKQRCKYIVPDWVEAEYSDNKFANLKDNVTKDIYKKLINLKSEKYLEAMSKKKLEDLDLSNIDKDLGFKKLNEKDCCGN